MLRRKDDGSLEVTVDRKSTHMDQYLNFHFYHLVHVKRGLVKFLFERARSITITQESLQKEEEHVVEALKQNGYPGTFICAASKALRSKEADQNVDMEETNRTTLVVLPYVSGVSEGIR